MSARAAATAPRAPGSTRRLSPRPRRISGPVRREVPPARRISTSPRAATARGGARLAIDVFAALERLSRHRLLDRLIRGRLWIGLVAFALIGIVTLQLALLKLNGGIGRALAREGVLQRENAALSVANSELASADRVQAQARSLGMEFVSTGALHFLTASPGRDVPRAASILATPLRPAGEELSSAGGAGSSAEGGQGAASASQGPETGEAASAGAHAGEPAAPAHTSEPGAPASAGAGEESSAAQGSPGGGEARSEATPAGAPASSESATGGGTQAGP
jgi:hypothetical protein